MSHSVFNFAEPVEQPPAEAEAEGQDDTQQTNNAENAEVSKENSEDILDKFQHVYVPEVVREDKMWFQTVPRLGAFMSVPIIYDSCLSDEALDSAITDYLKVTAENERLDKELEIHEAEQQQKADTAAANGETYEKEVKEIVKEELQPFNCTQKKFLICIDTMGQDCEITDDNRRAVLETINIFRAQWERAEVQCLTADRDRRIELMSRDPQIEAEIQERATETISKAVEDLLAIEVPEGTVVDEEQKQLDLSNLRLTT